MHIIIDINRMRNPNQCTHKEFGKKIVKCLHKWEDLVKRMPVLGNHRRFTLRCFGAAITLVSVKVKNTIRASKSFELSEKQKDNNKMNMLGISMTLLNLTV